MNRPLELFNAYLDGELSPEGWQQLEAWIAAEPGHAKLLLDWMAMQAGVREALQGDLLQQVLRDPQRQPGSGTTRLAPRTVPVKAIAWAALAASILAAVLSPLLLTPGARDEGSIAKDDRAEAATEGQVSDDRPGIPANDFVVASVTGLRDCVWQDAQPALGYGRQLTEGSRIALRSGVARITFECGAEALLKGPCDFTVDNAMHGTIRYGRVSVNAPKRAYGFRIRSPSAEVIDLGTEFGVAVDEQGDSEVHVFSGEVLSRSVDAEGEQQGELIRLTDGNGLKFSEPPSAPSKIASDTSQFARNQAAEVGASARASLPENSRLALWLAADVAVKTHERERRRVVAWPDILFGDNASAEDALQAEGPARPLLAPKGINGRPAIRFNGTSHYLVTTPLETTDNQTIFIVCQFGKGSMRPGRKRGGQILNYNGPPHRLVSSTYEPGVLQIGEPIVDKFTPTRLGGKLFSGRLDGRDVSESEMYAPPIGVRKPVVLAYRYDLDNHTSELRINNELIDQKPALRPAGITSRKVIGRHGFMKFFFAGDIGEVLIFNSALPAHELEAVTKYLGEKFDVALHESEARPASGDDPAA